VEDDEHAGGVDAARRVDPRDPVVVPRRLDPRATLRAARDVDTFPVVARDSADERWRTQALVPRRVDPTPRALRDGAQILGAADDASHDDVDRATRAV
jgi:hypothetical protein